jgi:hypothetical protein
VLEVVGVADVAGVGIPEADSAGPDPGPDLDPGVAGSSDSSGDGRGRLPSASLLA